jgi:cytochrome c oxidase cbb3-type subunit 3
MADLPTQFWSGWIIVITIVSLVALVWLLLSVYFAPVQESEGPTDTWDETLQEGFAAAPLWWFWLTVALLAFSVIYLMLYPGLGSFRGALAWSQGGELAERTEAFVQQFGGERERIAATDAAALASEEATMQSAWHVFNVNCSACHGRDAKGQANLFPDLSDSEWQWGGEAAQISQTISRGRQGVMPPWQTVLGDDGVAAMTDYLLALGDGTAANSQFSDSRAAFQTYCSACHAADGSGNALLGAPPLNDGNWVYGGDREAIAQSIAVGRTGVMPGFADRLDQAQIQMLTAWIMSGADPRQN